MLLKVMRPYVALSISRLLIVRTVNHPVFRLATPKNLMIQTPSSLKVCREINKFFVKK
jgi:hypothetical protein